MLTDVRWSLEYVFLIHVKTIFWHPNQEFVEWDSWGSCHHSDAQTKWMGHSRWRMLVQVGLVTNRDGWKEQPFFSIMNMQSCFCIDTSWKGNTAEEQRSYEHLKELFCLNYSFLNLRRVCCQGLFLSVWITHEREGMMENRYSSS